MLLKVVAENFVNLATNEVEAGVVPRKLFNGDVVRMKNIEEFVLQESPVRDTSMAGV